MVGTIPGAGTLARLGGTAGSKVLSRALSSAATTSLPRMADRTALARDIIDWAQSDTVRIGTESLAADLAASAFMADASRVYTRLLAG